MKINKDEFIDFLSTSGFDKLSSKPYCEYWIYKDELMVYFDLYPDTKVIHSVEVHVNNIEFDSYNFDVDATREILSAFYNWIDERNE